MRIRSFAIAYVLTMMGALPATAQDAARIEAAAAAHACLPAGTFTIERTVELRGAARLCGNGHEEGQKTTLRAADGLYAPMIRTTPEDQGWQIDSLIIDGNRHNRPVERCVGYRDGGSTIIARGRGFTIHDIGIKNTLCGSALEVGASDFIIENNRIEDSGFSGRTKPGPFGPWSDGITLLTCDGGTVRRNYLRDATDVAIVVGNSPRACRISENIITQVNEHAFAGIGVHHFDDSGKHPGLIVTANQVHAKINQLTFGLSVGVDVWDSRLFVADAGTVMGNISEGAWVTLDIQDIGAGRIEHNALGRAQGQPPSAGTGDCGRFPPAVYTTDRTGNATVQSGAQARRHADWCRP